MPRAAQRARQLQMRRACRRAVCTYAIAAEGEAQAQLL